jgi:Flp pilus assembly protein protease CpaA
MSAPAAPVLLVWVGAAALWDVRTRRIPNALVLVGLVLGLILAAFHGTWIAALSGAGIALALGIVPFALRALGGGDVKAAIVVGLFVGPAGVLKVVLLTALCSGIYAGIWWSMQKYISSKAPSSLPVGLPLCLATWGLILAG